jgi:STE24 endopeptidase
MLAPVVLWFMVVSVLPDLRGWVLAPVALVLLLALVVVQPLILNSVMGTRPLDDDLRERVLALCRDHGLRVRDARMLDSRGGRVANAAISGILPQVRYVYLTDHLIEILDDDEMNAVVAHEIGHGRGHHLLLKLLTGLAVPAVIVAAGALGGTGILRWFADSMGMLGFVLGFPLVFLTVLLLVHGVVGIALEKRADDYAVREIGLEPLARALDKLADANMMKRRTGWLWNVLQQHPGMEQRIKRLKDRADVGAHA